MGLALHTCNYYPGPVVGNPRIKATFKALDQRVREPAQVKLPATKEVVISAIKRITQSRSHTKKDKETRNTTIQSAWLLLLRSSEYCFVGEGTHDYCLRLGDVSFYDRGKREPSFRDARKAVTMPFVIRGSKAGQA